MSMIKLIIGTALGFLLAQGLLYVLGRLIGWPGQGDLRGRARPTPESPVLGALIRYAAPLGIGAALITLGVWAVNDYLAAKSARTAEASLFDSSTPVADAEAARRVHSASLAPATAPASEGAEAAAGAAPDPYADPEFKVQRKPHRGGAASLKETLVRESESRARDALLRELNQHVGRSQYDCEAAERAGKYLKAGLDVWGFASWQVKYFPVDSYRGATLERCRGIRKVVASSVDLQSAIAQQNHPDTDR